MGELVVEPSTTVHFKGPFYEPSMTEVKLTNNYSSERIAFKFLTTANTHFQVGIVYGLIMPRETVTVDILLQPLVDRNGRQIGSGTPFDRQKQKFMILWRPIMRGENVRTAEDGSQEMKELVNEVLAYGQPRKVKLSCVFDEQSNTPKEKVKKSKGASVRSESRKSDLSFGENSPSGTPTAKSTPKSSSKSTQTDVDSLENFLQLEVIATFGALLIAIIFLNFII